MVSKRTNKYTYKQINLNNLTSTKANNTILNTLLPKSLLFKRFIFIL